MSRMRAVFGRRLWAFLLSGTFAGLAIFAVAMVMRDSRDETIVLQVPPVSDPNVVQVWVGGEVATPGLYSLPRGSRVANAIEAAGGATEYADINAIGMAAVVDDADQIIVPALRPTVAPAPMFGVAGGPATVQATPGAPVSQTAGVININTAPAAELDSLPGIGPALSERIIQHRQEHGPFATIDDLEAVQGISQRMVDEMRHLITTGH